MRETGKVYLSGHCIKFGYAVQRELSDTPPKFYKKDLKWLRKLVDRYNRRFAA